MVVRLAGGKNIVVDSKVSLAAYLEAAEAADESVRERAPRRARPAPARARRPAGRQGLLGRAEPGAGFVVLFIPGEAFLAPALEHDPALLEHAIAHKVHIATPTTLVTMLRTAQYAWQQAALSENARAVFDVGRELYERLAGLGKHVDGLGKALTNAVTAYNRTVGSLESRVLVSARKLNELGLTDAELEGPRPVEETVRQLSAPDLIIDSALSWCHRSATTGNRSLRRTWCAAGPSARPADRDAAGIQRFRAAGDGPARRPRRAAGGRRDRHADDGRRRSRASLAAAPGSRPGRTGRPAAGAAGMG